MNVSIGFAQTTITAKASKACSYNTTTKGFDDCEPDESGIEIFTIDKKGKSIYRTSEDGNYTYSVIKCENQSATYSYTVETTNGFVFVIMFDFSNDEVKILAKPKDNYFLLTYNTISIE